MRVRSVRRSSRQKLGYAMHPRGRTHYLPVGSAGEGSSPWGVYAMPDRVPLLGRQARVHRCLVQLTVEGAVAVPQLAHLRDGRQQLVGSRAGPNCVRHATRGGQLVVQYLAQVRAVGMTAAFDDRATATVSRATLSAAFDTARVGLGCHFVLDSCLVRWWKRRRAAQVGQPSSGVFSCPREWFGLGSVVQAHHASGVCKPEADPRHTTNLDRVVCERRVLRLLDGRALALNDQHL